MKNIFKVSLFTLGLVLSSNAMAATGTGHAQAELSTPLSVATTRNVNFGTISVDPSAATQSLSMDNGGLVTCPATYVCTGATTSGLAVVSGAPNTHVDFSLGASTATLDDGTGKQLIFVPSTSVSGLMLGGDGIMSTGIYGSIEFTGAETMGTYNTTNAGGSPYTITVNY